MKHENRKYLDYFIIIIIISTIFLTYSYFSQKRIIDDMSSGFAVIQSDLSTLDKSITEVNKTLKEETINNLNLIQSVKKNSEQNINLLKEIIGDLESETEFSFGELRDDLAEVGAVSGDFSGVVQDVLPAVVSVITNKGQGSGAFIDDNYIVTNYHVIEGTSSIRILAYDKSTELATLIGYDPVVDIAVLKVSEPKETLNFGDSDDIKVGEKVIALGNPGGLDFSVTEGIVSATDRKAANGISYIQVDVPINPGNSGGPLINSKGKIIGITNFKIGGFESLGFAIPSNDVKEVVDQIILKHESEIPT